MKQRGRKSAASLSLVSPSGVEVIKRPEPPDDLTDEQSHEWRAIVNRLPADWFPRETHGLLTQYCRHIVAARRLSDLIEHIERKDTIDLDEYDKALKMQEREGRAISSLATRMRISQQASFTDKTPKGKAGIDKPWEDV
jgi:hypothetical protein